MNLKYLTAFIGCLLVLSACVDTKKNDKTKDSLSDMTKLMDQETAPVPQLQSIQGTVGEGTSMHSLELLTNEGDSLYFFYENNAIGGVTSGDKVVVTYSETDEELSAEHVVNLTSLAHLWKMADNKEKQLLEIDSEGRASSYGLSASYDEWMVVENKLILRHAQTADTLSIQILTEDSLLMSHGDQLYKMYKLN